MKKEEWIGEVLQTAKQVNPVNANPYLATRIEAKLHDAFIMRMPLRWVYTAVAAMLVLLCMNIVVWRSSNNSRDAAGVQQLLQEYGWVSNDIYSTNLLNRSHE